MRVKERSPLTRLQLETLEAVRKTNTYREAGKILGGIPAWKVKNRMATIRRTFDRGQLTVNLANSLRRDPMLRKKLLSKVTIEAE